MTTTFYQRIGFVILATLALRSSVIAEDQFDATLAAKITVGGKVITPQSPPSGLRLHPEVGIVADERLQVQLVHRTANPSIRLYETRATKTPKGDYLLMFPEGLHYGHEEHYHKRVNKMLAYRSSDAGKTWQGPEVAFDVPYGMHGFVPLIPRGTNRLYCFGTEPIAAERQGPEDCPIGFRYSDDDGHTWSEVTLIRPENAPTFIGMSVMRMTETDNGTWLLGSHSNKRWYHLPDEARTAETYQFVLRSENQGKTWHLHPPDGWSLPPDLGGQFVEGRPIHVGGGEVLFVVRTLAGQLWSMRSTDDGRTWSKPEPTSMVNPGAPPMVFHLSDGKTLISFFHNCFDGPRRHHHRHRRQIWVTLSTDKGHSWSEPRFLFANALSEKTERGIWLANNCSYIDMFVDDGQLHIFQPHRWRQALYLTIDEADLEKPQMKGEL